MSFLVALNTNRDAALTYAGQGIAVFPCHSIERGRCSCRRDCGNSAGKHPRTIAGHTEATTDPDVIDRWWSMWPTANIGANMKASRLVAIDIDPRNGGEDSIFEIARSIGGMPETWTSLTGGGGLHYLYRAPDGFDTHTDMIAPGVDVKWSGYVILPPSNHASGQMYLWESGMSPDDGQAAILPDTLAERIASQNGTAPHGDRLPIAELLTRDCPEGQRNNTLASIAGYLRNEVAQEIAEAMCQTWNAAHCIPPLEAMVVTRTVAGMYLRYPEPAKVILGEAPKKATRRQAWPAPLAEAAYHRLAGDLVRLADPCTEADPAAVLLTFLTMVGNAVGRGPHLTFGTEIHRCNIYIGLVGASGSGRKGTSLGPGRVVTGGADPGWAASRIANGLVSGEGVIYHVRDAASDESEGAGDWKVVKASKVTDSGVRDKRLLCIETELGGLLTAMHRQGSTLSHVLRAAWDGQKIQSLSKNAPVTSTGAHISVIGHITPDELRSALTSVDTANGFGNRFLWGLVKRSKVLPRPPAFEGPAVDALVHDLRDALDYGAAVGAMRLDAETGDAYDAYYRALPDDPPGLAGVMAVRMPAFVLRIAMIYALLDMTATIQRPHFEAALEVVRFCQDSARTIFGEMSGDPFADRIYEALQEGPLSKRQISVDVFSRNVPAPVIAAALKTLERAGLAYPSRQLTAGRPMEVWSAW